MRLRLPAPDPALDSYLLPPRRPWRCLFGFHDWVRRGGAYVKPRPTTVRIAGDNRPPPTGYVTERFEQCYRCDKTREGWWSATAPKPPPRVPEPWPACGACGHREHEHRSDGTCEECSREWRPGSMDAPPCMWPHPKETQP